ncbi:MAG: ferrous iron transport protein B [Nitrosomonadales bacterium]|nr:MAG: ferrous iron transport protein B [Nitrosomonadales bacterium]
MKRVALLGMPNTGKSTFFNRLTGASARIGNWPGITVELMSAKVLLGGAMVEIIDLPGVYDIHGFSDDELVVRHFLENNPVDQVLIILNTTQIERQLSLALQLKQLGLPAMLLLNMSDEAKKFGVTVDVDKMAQALAMPVVLLSAKYGSGYERAYQAISSSIQTSQPADIQEIRDKLKLENQLEAKMESVLRHSVQVPAQLADNLTTRLDSLLLHPWLGLPLFFGVMYVLFQAIFILGKPLQDGVAWALGLFRGEILEHLLLNLPAPVQGLLLDGIYNGVGTVAAFVPIIVLFFLFMALVEDSGYLSRAAFLMDALMARMGLDGRSFVMMLMGFGCNVPALMGTRVMRSRSLRLLSMLVIPFSLCSARLQVFVFITAALFAPRNAALVLFSLYLFSFAAALLTALLFKRHYSNTEPFILELPPYRLPTWRQIVLRGWHEVRHFLGRASKFIIAGVVLVWILTHFPLNAAPAGSDTWAGMIGGWLSPLLDPLGINQQLAIALIFGFVAKEIVIGSLAVIYGLEGTALMSTMAQQLDWVQAYSFMLFTLIYTPCLSTLATLRNESRSYAFTALALAWPLCLAWALSFAFYQGARALGY